jgi:hypothetical protein
MAAGIFWLQTGAQEYLRLASLAAKGAVGLLLLSVIMQIVESARAARHE